MLATAPHIRRTPASQRTHGYVMGDDTNSLGLLRWIHAGKQKEQAGHTNLRTCPTTGPDPENLSCSPCVLVAFQ